MSVHVCLEIGGREEQRRMGGHNDITMSLITRILPTSADFGFARYLSGTDLAATLCGSPLYMVSTQSFIFSIFYYYYFFLGGGGGIFTFP